MSYLGPPYTERTFLKCVPYLGVQQLITEAVPLKGHFCTFFYLPQKGS